MIGQKSEKITAKSALKACRGTFAGVGALSFVSNILMLTGPLFMLQIYDRVLASRSTPTLLALLLLVAVLFMFMGVIELIRARILSRIGLRIDASLRNDVFDNVVRAKSGQQAGGSVMVALRDLNQLRTFLSGAGVVAIFDAPWAPIYLWIVFLLHPWLGWVGVLGIVMLLTLSIANDLATRKPIADSAAMQAKAMTTADSGRRNADTLHAMGMVGSFRKVWARQYDEALETNMRAADRIGGTSAATRALRLFFQSLILAVGAYLAILQEVSPGAMIAASIITARALAPIEAAIAQWRGLTTARQSYERLESLLSEAPDHTKTTELPKPKGSVTVEGAVVVFPGRKEPILKGVDFAINPGDGLGVIGSSASGKTTLARALVGVCPLARGNVRLDGAPLDQWDPEQLGANIGYLPQEVELFEGTIEQNISRFREDATSEAVIQAAQMAGVHQLILDLPDGYQTQLADGVSGLSSGQRQRVALARALYGNPVLIVLDEPNSNLDAEGEAALKSAIEAMRRRHATVIVMAHRPSVISAVNKVLIMNDGKVAAFGPRDEVLKQHVKVVADPGAQNQAPNQRSNPGAA